MLNYAIWYFTSMIEPCLLERMDDRYIKLLIFVLDIIMYEAFGDLCHIIVGSIDIRDMNILVTCY